MISKEKWIFLPSAIMTILIADLVYRVYTRPQEFPYDLILVIVAVSLVFLYALFSPLQEFTQGKERSKFYVWYPLATVLGTLIGFASLATYQYLSTGTIQWEKNLSNLFSRFTVFAFFLVVLVIIGIINARAKDRRGPR